MLMHVDAGALQESSLWKELVEDRDIEGVWAEMSRELEFEWGVDPEDVESFTISIYEERGPDYLSFIRTSTELDFRGPPWRGGGSQEIEGVEVFPYYGGGVCALDTGLYVIAESLQGLEELLESEEDERGLDEDVRDLFERADWGADIVVALSVDELPREVIDELEEALTSMGIAQRDARVLRDILGALLSVRVGSEALELSLDVVGEDADAVGDVQELAQELIDVIEDLRDVPGELRDLVEDIELDTSGETLELTLTVEEDDLQDLLLDLLYFL